MSNFIEEQYYILGRLQKIDGNVRRVHQQLRIIPNEINKLEEDLKAEKEKFATLKEASESSARKMREAESELKAKESTLQAAEGKMMEVKTNEEYKAAMKQNEGIKTRIGELEESILNLMSTVEKDRNDFKAVEAEFKKFEAEYKEKKKNYETEISTVKAELETFENDRGKLLPELDNQYRSIYKRLASLPELDDKYIITIRDGQCGGCRVKIRPQVHNEVLGLNAIHYCGNCGRLLIAENHEDK